MCQRVPGKVVDPAISDLLLELVQPLTLEIALAVQQEVEARFVETDGLRQQHMDRARYEAELARRRYMSVDPLCHVYRNVAPERSRSQMQVCELPRRHITAAI